MPSPLTSLWRCPASPHSQASRAVSRPRDVPANIDRLFEESQQRRRARSCSYRRNERVFCEAKKEVVVCQVSRRDTVRQSSSRGTSRREVAETLREEVLCVPTPERRPLPGRLEPLSACERQVLGLDCDEVLPGLILASGKTVKTVAYMRELRVTHIINTASRDVWLPVEKMSNMGVELFQFHVDDVPSANLAPYFRAAADLVSRAQDTGGLLVVNCLVGLSRSAALLTAALMILRQWTVRRTLSTLRQRRQVKPNLGFMVQLLALEQQLREQGVRLS